MMEQTFLPHQKISNGDLSIEFTPRGRIFSIAKGDILLSKIPGSDLYRSVSDLFIRLGKDNAAYSLFECATSFSSSSEEMVYEGLIGGLSYSFSIAIVNDELIQYRVKLFGNAPELNALFVDDCGVGTRGSVVSNELYNAQYLDISPLKTPYGIALAAKQNMGGIHPLLVDASYGISAISYCTDEMEYLGPSYKESGIPELLCSPLPGRVYQGELSCLILETEEFALTGEKTFSFLSFCKRNINGKCGDPAILDASYKAIDEYKRKEAKEIKIPSLAKPFSKVKPLRSLDINSEALNALYPERILEEKDGNGELLSFFLPDNTHVILKRKERRQRRPSGSIILSPLSKPDFEEDNLASTNYSYGLFNAQIVAGNTNLNKLLSVNRGLLDTNKEGGQRILVKTKGDYHILGLPSIYEIGFNYSKWIYILPDDVLTITNWMSFGKEIHLLFEAKNNPYEIVITNQLVLGEQEYSLPYVIEKGKNGEITLRPSPASFQGKTYPKLSFVLEPGEEASEAGDGIFYADGEDRNHSLLTLSYPPAKKTSITIRGSIFGENLPIGGDFAVDKEKFLNYQKNLLGHLKIADPLTKNGQILDTTLFWYSLDAMIHFASPHGLEQSGGAAWGTRDVCQGPFEYFLSLGKFSFCQNIIRRVFSNQNQKGGEWPQWFMMDRYGFRADDCHGDIVFWPLKILADYLIATGDYDLLLEKMPYYKGEETPLYDHLEKAIESIEERMIPGYDLLTYAGGDWDDTLQPIDEKSKSSLVSAWTQALLYETTDRLQLALSPIKSPYCQRLGSLSTLAKEGFDRYLIKNRQIAGFAHIRDDKLVDLLLHPDDKETGIHTRLLPLTRSIISEIASPKSVPDILDTIDTKLLHKDGVRLMDAPANYDGGLSHIFVRAEQASNVGREISLLYVHADIRYAEAMAKIGESGRVKKALFQVTPILLEERVENVLPRQSNAYFSSSDPDFPTRYAFKKDFSLLKKGKVGVRGGWRVYSSGPGIFTARVIRDMFGLRIKKESLIIDPSLDYSFDGASLSLELFGKNLTVRYHLIYKGTGVINVKQDKKVIKALYLENPYRNPGVEVRLADLDLNKPIEVYLR